MIGVEAKAWKQKRHVFHACMCEAKPAELRSFRLDGAAHTARRPFRSIISLRILPFVVVFYMLWEALAIPLFSLFTFEPHWLEVPEPSLEI